MECSNKATKRPRILIVDDSLTVRMDLREMLESGGFAVTTCETLAAARAVLASERFSLVILDVLLPDGDGVALLREIKSDPARAVPVMLLSTEAEVRDRVRGLQTGADAYVGKPYDGSYILARALQLSGRREKTSRGARAGLLLIDGSPAFRADFRAILEDAGYGVTAVESPEEGLNTAFALLPDVVIVASGPDGGADACSLIQRMKQDITLRNTPCLLLTACVDPGEELRMLEAGADAFLTKETDVHVILARIAGLLRSGGLPHGVGSSASSLLGAKKILAVDDSITFLSELSVQLRAEGYDLIQASSAREALELLEVQNVDCILLDVRMPEISGVEACRLVKKKPSWRNIPLLMLTAADEAEAMVEGINAGADDYISKSSDFAVLKARVRAQLRRKQFEDEHRLIGERLLQQELNAAQARAAQEIAEARAAMVDELEKKNRELEAFTYAVAHDLRAPLRAIRGFAQALVDDFGGQLPAGAHRHLDHMRSGVGRMSRLIESLLELSRCGQTELYSERFDFSALARSVASELEDADKSHHVDWSVEEGLIANGDAALVRVALHNLMENAWKYTGRTPQATVEVGALEEAGGPVYFIRDNGIGFDAKRAQRLFQPFERLHSASEFPGAGIGLATVRRIVKRHGGEIRAESEQGKGAAFFFTLGAECGSNAG